MNWFSGIIPRVSLIQHNLYVGVVEKAPRPPLTREQYGKMKPKYREGGDDKIRTQMLVICDLTGYQLDQYDDDDKHANYYYYCYYYYYPVYMVWVLGLAS